MNDRITARGRRVVANISLSLDGRVNGRDGDHDMSWIVPHAVTDAARDQMVRMTSTATTGLLGRKNYQGFGGFWPAVAKDENADPRDRSFGQWLDDVEKVVFSTTLDEAPWQNSRISDDPVGEVRRLRKETGGDIVVLSSASIIKALLDADEVDRLIVNLCPELVGGGARLFEDGLPRSSWALTDTTSTGSGSIYLVYDRADA